MCVISYILKMAEKGDNKQMVLKLLECLKSIEASDSVLRPVLQSLLKISSKFSTTSTHVFSIFGVWL